MFNSQYIYSFGQIQTSQTGGQPYSDTSPYNVSECSLYKHSSHFPYFDPNVTVFIAYLDEGVTKTWFSNKLFCRLLSYLDRVNLLFIGPTTCLYLNVCRSVPIDEQIMPKSRITPWLDNPDNDHLLLKGNITDRLASYLAGLNSASLLH